MVVTVDRVAAAATATAGDGNTRTSRQACGPPSRSVGGILNRSWPTSPSSSGTGGPTGPAGPDPAASSVGPPAGTAFDELAARYDAWYDSPGERRLFGLDPAAAPLGLAAGRGVRAVPATPSTGQPTSSPWPTTSGSSERPASSSWVRAPRFCGLPANGAVTAMAPRRAKRGTVPEEGPRSGKGLSRAPVSSPS